MNGEVRKKEEEERGTNPKKGELKKKRRKTHPIGQLGPSGMETNRWAIAQLSAFKAPTALHYTLHSHGCIHPSIHPWIDGQCMGLHSPMGHSFLFLLFFFLFARGTRETPLPILNPRTNLPKIGDIHANHMLLDCFFLCRIRMEYHGHLAQTHPVLKGTENREQSKQGRKHLFVQRQQLEQT